MAMMRTYTETYDMNTEQDCPTLLGIHTPIGPTMYNMLAPAFRMYKKYKYIGCDITIVNSARLPIDPEQVGKISGSNYIDPRDTLNPIMFKGCHGESMGVVLDSMYDGLLLTHKGTSLDREKFKSDLEAFYYTALGDDGWRKSSIQKTLSVKNLHPLVYSLSTNHQILPTNNLPIGNYVENSPAGVTGNVDVGENGQFNITSNGWTPSLVHSTKVYPANGDSTTPTNLRGLNTMFTSKMHRLGWLDTLQYIGRSGEITNPLVPLDGDIALLPKVMMGILMLPPAYLCRQYLRVIIRHKIKFAGYRGVTFGAALTGTEQSNLGNYGYWYTGNQAGSSKDKSDSLPNYQFSEEATSTTCQPPEWELEPMESDDEDE